MALLEQINGPALIYANVGAALAQVALGITERGVEPDLTYYDEPIIADNGGLRVPVELQDMGFDGFLDLAMPIYDEAVWRAIAARRQGQSSLGNEGKYGVFGSSIVGNAWDVAIEIRGANPLYFPHCVLRKQREPRGTKFTVLRCGFYIFGGVRTAVTPAGVKVYDRTTVS